MNLILKRNQITLRKLRRSDAPDLQKAINHRDISRWTILIPYPYTMADAREFIANCLKHYRKKDAFPFAIVSNETGKLVGVTKLDSIHVRDRRAELGYWLSKDYRGRGLTTEAVNLTCKFAFKSLKLHKVFALTFVLNTASQKVLKKNGFTLEGKLRKAQYKNRRWHDMLYWGLLDGDFKKQGQTT